MVVFCFMVGNNRQFTNSKTRNTYTQTSNKYNTSNHTWLISAKLTLFPILQIPQHGQRISQLIVRRKFVSPVCVGFYL